MRRHTNTAHRSLARVGLGLVVASLGLACATGETDSNNMSSFSAGNQTESGTDSTAGTDGTDSGNSDSDSGSGSNSDSNGTTTNSTNSTMSSESDSSDSNPTSTTDPTTGPGCIDMDGDGYGENCGLGPDCNDDDYNNYTEEGCANCVDMDADDIWTGCDQYDENKQGPDCDDNNESVGLDDAVEICNGLSENCAGEVDPLPPDDMCPTQGDPPNVVSWLCEPPAPGEDGCVVGSCDEQWFDVNGDGTDGCECQGTDRTKSIEVCGDSMAGSFGTVAEGATLDNLVVGTIPALDNGVGNGAEDWYWVEFPEQMANGTRPNAGINKIYFAQNDGSDYRFELYRECGGDAWAGSLAKEFGDGAPPALEWWFQDSQAYNAKYSNQVTWPGKVYVRVFRVQNDNTCSSYQLKVERAND